MEKVKIFICELEIYFPSLSPPSVREESWGSHLANRRKMHYGSFNGPPSFSS